MFKRSSGYKPVLNSHNLCLLEKLAICDFQEKNGLINRGLYILSEFRHEKVCILPNYSGID